MQGSGARFVPRFRKGISSLGLGIARCRYASAPGRVARSGRRITGSKSPVRAEHFADILAHDDGIADVEFLLEGGHRLVADLWPERLGDREHTVVVGIDVIAVV